MNDKADKGKLLLCIKSWLTRSDKQDKTDVYVFSAGHGFASEDREKQGSNRHQTYRVMRAEYW